MGLFRAVLQIRKRGMVVLSSSASAAISRGCQLQWWRRLVDLDNPQLTDVHTLLPCYRRRVVYHLG